MHLTNIQNTRAAASAAFRFTSAIALIIGAAATAQATVDLGNPYTPTGANYSISAVQGIDSSSAMGSSNSSTQVNLGFEFSDGIGVAYDNGGKAKEFGIGLYSLGGGKSATSESTGLNIKFNQATLASTVSITLADFDIQAGKDTSFKSGKVAPSILLLSGNSVVGSADPTQIFASMTPTTGQTKSSDYWKLDFSKLLQNANIKNGNITGFLLYADDKNGEKANSDPYFLTAISGGAGMPVVPEPGTYAAGLGLIALIAITAVRSRARKSALARA